MIFYGIYPSPFGEGLCLWNSEGVLRISFPGADPQTTLSGWEKEFGEITKGSALILDELAGYFRGELRTFQSRPFMVGTEFQQRVWNALLAIPYGETRTYGRLAEAIGDLRAARAVGTACGKNPLPILIPCHRVVAGQGLGGFGGGLEMKRRLLAMESNIRHQ